MNDFIVFFRQSVKKHPITKFFIKLVVAEWLAIIAQLIVPQVLYRWH